MSSMVYRRIPSCDADLLREAGEYGVADLHESLGVVSGYAALMRPDIRPLNSGIRVVGQASTVLNYPGDGLMTHKAVQIAAPGHILVISSAGGDSAMFAELVALAALQRGVRGVVVDGAIRDVDALRAMNFPIWSRSVHAAHTEKRGPGAVNVPLVCGGALVNPGDIIAADGDGVIVIARAMLERAVVGARARALREVEIRRRIGAGETLFDILDIQTYAEAALLDEVDDTWDGAES